MKFLILVNPAAGHGQGRRWLEAFNALDEDDTGGASLQVEVTSGSPESGVLGTEPQGWDRVYVVGGDGTVSHVVRWLFRGGCMPPLGIIPVGTGNDLARSLGLYTGRPWSWEEAMRYLRSKLLKVVDLWAVNGKLTFQNYMSLGLDAEVVSGFSRKRRLIQRHPFLGRRGIYFSMYLLVWLRHLGDRLPEGTTLTWEDHMGGRHQTPMGGIRVLAVTNTPYYAAGALMAPEARVDDGIVEITSFGNMREYAELMAMRFSFLCGRGVQRGWRRMRARAFELALPQGASFQLDGEDTTGKLPLPGVLSVKRAAALRVFLRRNE